MPAGPVRDLMRSWLDEQDVDDPFQRLVALVGTSASQVRSVLANPKKDRSDTVDFDLADLILCRLDHPELWLEDPVLKAAYQGLDLKSLDRDRPVVSCAA